MADSGGHILPNLMVFGEVLRRLGLEFGSNNMLDLVRAAQDNTIGIPIGRKQDFQHAARCLPRLAGRITGLHHQHLQCSRGELPGAGGTHRPATDYDNVVAGSHLGPMKLFETSGRTAG